MNLILKPNARAHDMFSYDGGEGVV